MLLFGPTIGRYLWPKKNICAFQVSQPYLDFCPNPKHFIVNLSKMLSDLLKNGGKCIEKCKFYIKYFDKIKYYADRLYLVFSELKPETHIYIFFGLTRICAFKFNHYWLSSVLDFHNHFFFHWFLMEKKCWCFWLRSFCAVIYQWDFFLQMVRYFTSHQCQFHLKSMYGGLDVSYGSNNVKIDKEGALEVWSTWKR